MQLSGKALAYHARGSGFSPLFTGILLSILFILVGLVTIVIQFKLIVKKQSDKTCLFVLSSQIS